jgi:NAD(P)-dependent dehydrogenase (short-subunit alcohol dehydrogenase family)
MTHQEPSAEPTVAQLLDLRGKVALVTGGSGHLGRAMCRALAEAGASVVATSRSIERAEAVVAELPVVQSAGHFGIALDHMQPERLKTDIDSVLANTGKIDVLINNAHEGLAADWTDVTPAQFSRQLENATGYFELARLVRDAAVARNAPASIVLVASMYGLVGSYPDAYAGICGASPAAYQTLKGGIIQMARHLAVYWAADRIRVNCLSPGPFPGPQAPPELVSRLAAKSPLGRMGRPSELKGAIVFLASDASSYVTGHNLVVDGGWTAW